MQASLMAEGLTLMLAGMGTVFVFLTALVFAMTAMSFLLRRPAEDAAGVGDDEVAVIAAAIDAYRRGRPD